ncbi:MAG: DNA polymerase III subunit epsilon [Deltaproteobacteria bacterium]|nr:DNA polymerase III subunit epsilon [Candidatus Anaeroferrophillacea bacterium]
MTREIVLDTETTGMPVQHGHRLVEVACLELVDGRPTGSIFHERVNPGRSIDWRATRVHGISDDEVCQCPDFGDIVGDFITYVGDSPVVIHNAGFDLGFLRHETRLAGLPVWSPAGVVDTLLMARRLFPGRRNNLNALCRRFAIDLSGRMFHGALIDCRLLAQVYRSLREHEREMDAGRAVAGYL